MAVLTWGRLKTQRTTCFDQYATLQVEIFTFHKSPMLHFWVDKNVMCCSLLLTEGRFTPHLSGTDGALAMELPEYGVVAVAFLFYQK